MSSISDVGMDDLYAGWETCSSPIPFIKQLDYIPLVSTITGIVQFIFGFFEFIFGIFALPFELAYAAAKTLNRQYTIIDALGYMLRGLVVSKPIIGNIIIYLWDHSEFSQYYTPKTEGAPLPPVQPIKAGV